MNLGVFTDQIFWYDGEQYTTDEAFITFILSFSCYFDKIKIFDRLSPERKKQRYGLDSQNVELYGLPFYAEAFDLYKHGPGFFFRTYTIIKDNLSDCDLVWVIAPHPLNCLVWRLCRKAGKPFFFTIRTNMQKQIRCKFTGIKRVVSLSLERIMDIQMRMAAKDAPIFAVGSELYTNYKRTNRLVFNLPVSLISSGDVVKKKDVRAGFKGPYSLLYVGRLEREKGLDYLIDAVHQMVRDGGFQICLDLVGSGTQEKALREKVEDLGLGRYVRFLGDVTFGPALLEIYDRSDIFLLPSLTEGVPQVLFEAMARGVPVVVSKVGGIPEIVRHGQNGLLVNPCFSSDIVRAVREIIVNVPLMSRLITNGLETAKSYTRETQRERMMKILHSCFLLNVRKV